jgi:hypothetical protein
MKMSLMKIVEIENHASQSTHLDREALRLRFLKRKRYFAQPKDSFVLADVSTRRHGRI